MAFAERVVHLGEDGDQSAICPVTVPEAHGLEGVTQYARIGGQPDRAVGDDAVTGQQCARPGQCIAALAVVAFMKAQ